MQVTKRMLAHRLALVIVPAALVVSCETVTLDPAATFAGTFTGTATRQVTCTDTGVEPEHTGTLTLVNQKIDADHVDGRAVVPYDADGHTTICSALTFTILDMNAWIPTGETACRSYVQIVDTTTYTTEIWLTKFDLAAHQGNLDVVVHQRMQTTSVPETTVRDCTAVTTATLTE